MGMMSNGWRLVTAVCVAMTTTACSGGSHAKQGTHSTSTTTVARSGRQVTLALAAGGTVRAALPAQPIATTRSIANGVDLEVWQVQRSRPAVTVVLSLHNTSAQNVSGPDESRLESALDLNNGKAGDDNPVVNNVGLLDTSALKNYGTFCNTNVSGVLTNCLGSADNFYTSALKFTPGYNLFIATVVAAPPAPTKTVTLVTGVGSVPNVPISG